MTYEETMVSKQVVAERTCGQSQNISSPELVCSMLLDDLCPDDHVHDKASQILQSLHKALQAQTTLHCGLGTLPHYVPYYTVESHITVLLLDKLCTSRLTELKIYIAGSESTGSVLL